MIILVLQELSVWVSIRRMRYVLPATNSSLGELLLYKDTFLYNVSQIGVDFKLRYWGVRTLSARIRTKWFGSVAALALKKCIYVTELVLYKCPAKQNWAWDVFSFSCHVPWLLSALEGIGNWANVPVSGINQTSPWASTNISSAQVTAQRLGDNISCQITGPNPRSELCFKQHVAHAIAKGTKRILQLRRLAKPTQGLSYHNTHHLYHSIAIPKILHAVDIWYTPIRHSNPTKKAFGSVGFANKLGR